MRAVRDNFVRPFNRSHASGIGYALLSDEDLAVVLRVIDVANHRHHFGNRAVRARRRRSEDREITVAHVIARTADPVDHLTTGGVRRIRLPVNIKLNRSVDRDDAQATNDFRMIGNIQRPQNQRFFIQRRIFFKHFPHRRRRRKRATRRADDMTVADQMEYRVL